MAYETPTAAELIARYPAFAAVAEATIDIYIGDAISQSVDRSWRAQDYGPAVVAKAAHEMALIGLGEQSEAATHAQSGITGVRSGNFQISISNEVANRLAKGGLSATPYGRVYKRLLLANKGGPRVVGRAGYAGAPPADGYLP